MALFYSHQQAKLGTIEGTGYAFRVQSVTGDHYRGVFIGTEADAEAIKEVAGQTEELTFTGVMYRRSRSGSVSSERAQVSVAVTSCDTVALGPRAIFEVNADA